jgi:hypothetical protein
MFYENLKNLRMKRCHAVDAREGGKVEWDDRIA